MSSDERHLGRFAGFEAAELYDVFARSGLTRRLLEIARDEDLMAIDEGQPLGDATTEACGIGGRAMSAVLRAREDAVVCGLAAIRELIDVYAACGVEWHASTRDGASLESGAELGTLSGSASEVLTLERPMLNLIGRLSGIATETRRFVEAVAGTGATICDTRKTTPGLRAFEKYAVFCGGGTLHRFNLADAVLVKDNHIAGVAMDDLPAFVGRAAERARASRRVVFIEVEVDSLEQFERVLESPAGSVDIVLLDNMDTATMSRAAGMRQERRPGLLLEASGGVTLESVRSIAESGVDRISVGGLTHRVRSVDVGLDID